MKSFLVSSSSCCHGALPHFVRPWWQKTKWSWRLSFILQSSIAPSLSRGRLPWRRRWISFFDTGRSESKHFCGSISVQILFPISMVLVDDKAEYRFCGFALAFDRNAESPSLNFNAYSSNCISEVSRSLLFKFVTNLLKPWVFLTHEWEWSLFTDLILISTPYLPCRQQVVNSNTGPILEFPLIQPFGSSLCEVYVTESVNCENYSMSFVMKYCPTSWIIRNPVSVQNLLNLSCCGNFSIRSPYLCNRIFWCAGSSLFKDTFVLITLDTSEKLGCPPTTGLPVLSW